MKTLHRVFVACALVAGFLVFEAQLVAKRPNILFVISDDQSYPHASAYGCRGIRTPGFDRVAKRGVLFRTCIAGSPGCSPSRATVLTGRYHWLLEHAGTHASKFDSKYATFPDLLEKAGYGSATLARARGRGIIGTAVLRGTQLAPFFHQKRKIHVSAASPQTTTPRISKIF